MMQRKKNDQDNDDSYTPKSKKGQSPKVKSTGNTKSKSKGKQNNDGNNSMRWGKDDDNMKRKFQLALDHSLYREKC
jgi:hypothetical protein